MCGVLYGQVAGLVPELELQLNSNSNSGIGIDGIENGIGIENCGIEIEKWNWIYWLLPQHLLINQQFPNFSFNRGHNLPCDWLLMQRGCFKFLEHSLPPWHKTNYYYCWIKWNEWFQGLGWNYAKVQVLVSFTEGIFRSFMIIHWYKCHRTLLINLVRSPHCFR